MASSRDSLLARARQFIEWDVNPETRAQAQAMVDTFAAEAADAPVAGAFASAFGPALEFGTAGLRGEMGPGFGRMNDLTVIQAAQGLIQHLDATFGSDAASLSAARERGVVLGFDHRALGSLNSRRFAVLTAIAATARGWRVYLMDRITLTPLVPFSILHVNAAAGVMVTASHNPKRDNGYKVYWGNGAQIIAPVDKGIAAAIAAPEQQAPWPACRAAYEAADEAALRANPLVVDRTDELLGAYIAAVTADQRHAADVACSAPGAGSAAAGGDLHIAYTAMHGVGAPFVHAMFDSFGLPQPTRTPEQCDADPEFPTVVFPNPEEGKGALALAMATAAKAGASLILANDPDADRLAVAEWQASAAGGAIGAAGAGEWRIFTGNEIGALLGAYCFERYAAAGGAPGDAMMVASTVSSKFLGALAAAEGFTFKEVLTGFKFMGNEMEAARKLPGGAKRVIFAFEEAIGFACGDTVRDKDGVSAAAVFAQMAYGLRSRGLTVAQRLGQLFAKYGLHLSRNHYLFVDEPSKTNTIFARLRNEGHYWKRIGGSSGGSAAAGAPVNIVAIRDLTSPGWDSEAADGKPSLPTSGGSHMITYKFSNGVVATLRTSGTEPKLKYYTEIRGDAAAPDAARAELERTVDLIMAEMLQPERYGLKW